MDRNDAFVNVLALASTRDEFTQLVRDGIAQLGQRASSNSTPLEVIDLFTAVTEMSITLPECTERHSCG